MRENDISASLVVLFTCLISPSCVFAQQIEENVDAKSASRGYILRSGEGEDTVGDGSSLTKASPKTGTQGVVFVDDKMPPSGFSCLMTKSWSVTIRGRPAMPLTNAPRS